jgi:multisubunit Na+/H+ antiporter MnhF subunit
VAIIALYAMRTDAASLLDAAIITAILGFVGTMMLARYMERAELRDWETDKD